MATACEPAPGSTRWSKPGALLEVGQCFDSTHVVIAASEDRDGRWTVSLHFAQPPTRRGARLIGLTAGPETANALVFETTAATDWVQASLQADASRGRALHRAWRP